MILTVSISELRNNISTYLEKAMNGAQIIIRDEKKGEQVAQLTGKKEFDSEAFERALRQASGVFTAKNHPEWRTKKDIINWVRKSRLAADRHF